MATERDWADAYHRQAIVDLEGARLIREPSLVAMLLQMALEKLGKAALLRSSRMSIELPRLEDFRPKHGGRTVLLFEAAHELSRRLDELFP